MTRFRFVCQFKTERMWSDEFWSYDPVVFYRELYRLSSQYKWRAVLRIIETKTFEEIQYEQGKI